MKKDKISEITGRRPFYDGPIDIKRWKARRKMKQLREKIRSLLRKNRGK